MGTASKPSVLCQGHRCREGIGDPIRHARVKRRQMYLNQSVHQTGYAVSHPAKSYQQKRADKLVTVN